MESRRIVEQLTKDELRHLKAITAPYGKLKDVADEVNIHVNTLRNIIRNGGGLVDNVASIRKTVLSAKVENITNKPNVAA